MTPLLDVRNLRASFRTDAGPARAVDGVSLAIAPGESVGVVGESGCGKSTLSLAILGLLPASGTITGGEVIFSGQNLVQAANIRQIRGKRIGIVFQDPMTSLNPFLRVGTQIVEQMREHLPLTKAQARERAVKLLDDVGIPDPAARIDRYPHELSGGQRQRVLIAMALSCDPELLIADEPTTALDVTIQAQILALIREQQKRRKMALLLITHNLGVVAGMCDRVAVMYAGRIVEQAPARALFTRPQHPYTRGLLAAVPRLDGDRGRPLHAIPGGPPSLTEKAGGCAFAPRCQHAQAACREQRPELRSHASDHDKRCILDLGTSP